MRDKFVSLGPSLLVLGLIGVFVWRTWGPNRAEEWGAIPRVCESRVRDLVESVGGTRPEFPYNIDVVSRGDGSYLVDSAVRYYYPAGDRDFKEFTCLVSGDSTQARVTRVIEWKFWPDTEHWVLDTVVERTATNCFEREGQAVATGIISNIGTLPIYDPHLLFRFLNDAGDVVGEVSEPVPDPFKPGQLFSYEVEMDSPGIDGYCRLVLYGKDDDAR